MELLPVFAAVTRADTLGPTPYEILTAVNVPPFGVVYVSWSGPIVDETVAAVVT